MAIPVLPSHKYVKLHDGPAVRIKTLTVRQPKRGKGRLEEVLADYRRRFQRTKAEAETAIANIVLPEGARPTSSQPAYQCLFRPAAA